MLSLQRKKTEKQSTEDVGHLTQWQLITRRFRRNKLSVIGITIISVLYLLAIFADFFAPNPFDVIDMAYTWAPPTTPRLQDGRLIIYPLVGSLNLETLSWEYQVDTENPATVKFFIRGYPYKLWGLIPADVHFIGVDAPAKLYLWGADRQGRDLFARVLFGGRVSLTIGLVSIGIATILGAILGTMSGYYGGVIDNVMQRMIELISSFPTIPLWAALATALPQHMAVVQRFLLISIILSLISWTGLARQVRGKVMGYRSTDYTVAAKAAGASDWQIITRHLIPNSISHIIVVATLSIPGSIMGETALSWLGLGILPPAVSWGVLLRDAQQLQVILTHTWMLLPGVAVILAILCFSFLGDGLRDAVDPYS